MVEKISFFVFLVLDIFFVVTGLLYLRSPIEAIWGLLFLIFVWFVLWSAQKIRMYVQEENTGSFIKYYCNYLLTAVDTIGNDKQFGPTRFFRLTMIFLSTLGGLIGVGTVIVLNYETVLIALSNRDLLFRYLLLFVYIVVYPFMALILRTIISGSNTRGLMSTFLTFFPLRFTQLFIYFFTFVSPAAWLGIAILSYVSAKSKYINETK